MAGERTYAVPKQVADDLRAAYDKVFILEDINRKEREAGNPDGEREGKVAEMRTRIERRAAAYGIDLE